MERVFWGDGSSSAVLPPSVYELKSYNGRGNVQVIEHQTSEGVESAALLINNTLTVYERFTSEPHEPGRPYWFFKEDLWIPNQWGENLTRRSPRVARRFLHMKLAAHLHLPEGFRNSAEPLRVESNPFNPQETQIYIGQGIQFRESALGDRAITRTELSLTR